jgi:transcriptional regulator with XRE-family HTH domain
MPIALHKLYFTPNDREVSRVYIAQMETGKQDNPTLKVLRALAKALRVDVAKLIR